MSFGACCIGGSFIPAEGFEPAGSLGAFAMCLTFVVKCLTYNNDLKPLIYHVFRYPLPVLTSPLGTPQALDAYHTGICSMLFETTLLDLGDRQD